MRRAARALTSCMIWTRRRRCSLPLTPSSSQPPCWTHCQLRKAFTNSVAPPGASCPGVFRNVTGACWQTSTEKPPLSISGEIPKLPPIDGYQSAPRAWRTGDRTSRRSIQAQCPFLRHSCFLTSSGIPRSFSVMQGGPHVGRGDPILQGRPRNVAYSQLMSL